MTDSRNFSASKEFTLTRVLNAPRDLVFKAFTEAEHLAHWWGPKGVKLRVAKLELKPGGIFHYCMLFQEGMEMWGRFKFVEVNAPEKISFINSFSDENGNVIAPPFPEPWPTEILNTWVLTENKGKTTLTLTAVAYNAGDEERKIFEDGFESMNNGYGGSLDVLEDYIKSL